MKAVCRSKHTRDGRIWPNTMHARAADLAHRVLVWGPCISVRLRTSASILVAGRKATISAEQFSRIGAHIALACARACKLSSGRRRATL